MGFKPQKTEKWITQKRIWDMTSQEDQLGTERKESLDPKKKRYSMRIFMSISRQSNSTLIGLTIGMQSNHFPVLGRYVLDSSNQRKPSVMSISSLLNFKDI